MPTNSSVGVGEFVDDFGDKTKVGSGDVESDDCPPHELVYSSKEGRRVRWKLDTILLPLMAFTYILNYIDKVSLSEASIFGIKDDLHLVGQQYSWSSSIFYLGYLVWQYPSSLLMQKLPIGRYFGVMIFLWGLTATTTAFTTSFATLCVNRVFLGVFETCMSPILTILISQYWTRDEQPLRTSLWWSASAVGAFIADAITYGVSGKDHSGSKYAIWQIIYLVFGPLTLLWGMIIFFGVPSSPVSAWFLNKRERKIATARVMENHTSIKNTEYKFYQVKECLTDPQPWILALHAFLQCLQGGGLTSFSKIVLTETLGYTSRQATLMSMPSNTIHLVSVVFAGWFCSRFRNTRCYVMISTNIIVLIGAVLVGNLPESNQQGRLAAFYILYVNTVPFGLGMSMISSNIAGFTKKSTASVMMFLGYCLGQFTGPQFFIETEAPRYHTAFRGFYSSVSAMIILELVLLAQSGRREKKRKASGDANTSQEQSPPQLSQQTDALSPADDSRLLEASSLSLLDTTTMPWMDGIFDSYLGPQWDLTPDSAVLWSTTTDPITINDFPDQTPSMDANSSTQIFAEFNMPASDQQGLPSSSPSAVSDHVLAQHYTQNLTTKYTSKEQGWNHHTYFFNRFNSSHPFVISSLYAWTAAHLFCNGTVDSEANAMEHYEKSLASLGDQLGVDLLSANATDDASQNWFALLAQGDDMDAVSVTLYFLAWTDLILSRRVALRRMLNLEALLLERRGHDQSHSVYVRMAVWFCFLDARAILFCRGNDRIIQSMGDDSGLVRAVEKSHDFLQKEYKLLYPKKERRWDEAHLPLSGSTSDDGCEADVRASLDNIKQDLDTISEAKAAESKVLSIYLTTSALFHTVEIYASRIYRPHERMYAESQHAESIITITRRFYQKLKRPRTEAPPTKIWPVPLIMAAIEAKDPIYRDWTLQQIRDYSRTGKHFANACAFVEKVHAAEEVTSSRTDLGRIAEDMGDDFVL
ncbi:hypothetical protein AUP68_15296 [Ilyonectria robusta]